MHFFKQENIKTFVCFCFLLFSFLFDVNHDDVYVCASVSDFILFYECAPVVLLLQ